MDFIFCFLLLLAASTEGAALDFYTGSVEGYTHSDDIISLLHTQLDSKGQMTEQFTHVNDLFGEKLDEVDDTGKWLRQDKVQQGDADVQLKDKETGRKEENIENAFEDKAESHEVKVKRNKVGVKVSPMVARKALRSRQPHPWDDDGVLPMMAIVFLNPVMCLVAFQYYRWLLSRSRKEDKEMEEPMGMECV